MKKRQSLYQKSLGWLRESYRPILLPAAVLALAGLLLTAGDWLGRAGWTMAMVLTGVGSVILKQIPLLIAASLAYSRAVEHAGSAAVAGAAAWLVLDAAGSAVCQLLNAGQAGSAPFSLGLLGGLLAGILAGYLHNRSAWIKLPPWLAFLTGQRLAVLLAVLAALPAGMALGVIWAFLQRGLTELARALPAAGAEGAFVYGFLNRLLLPLGLHQVLNQEIWFRFGDFTSQSGNQVLGDLNRFLAGDPTAGRYIAGFYPVIIFAVPAIAASFILTARRRHRSWVLLLAAAAGLASLLSGATEPVEVLLLFCCPALYLVYALLSGLSQLVCYQLQIHIGFQFSTGLSDYLANSRLAINPERIWQAGIALAALTLAVFYLAIVLLKLRTPGREPEPEAAAAPESAATGEPASEPSAAAPEEPATEPAPAEDAKPEPDPVSPGADSGSEGV